jgi:hypothetical protein
LPMQRDRARGSAREIRTNNVAGAPWFVLAPDLRFMTFSSQISKKGLLRAQTKLTKPIGGGFCQFCQVRWEPLFEIWGAHATTFGLMA